MNKRYDVITIDKDLAVVVDKEVKQDDIIIEIASKIMGVYQHDKLHGTHDICIPEKAFPFNTPEYFRKIVGVITETPMKDFPLVGLPLVVLPEENRQIGIDFINSDEQKHTLSWNAKQFIDYDLAPFNLTPEQKVHLQKKLHLKMGVEKSNGYNAGYKAAQQKGTFTEEEVVKKAEAFYNQEHPNEHWTFGSNYAREIWKFIQSLQSLQPKRFPVAVELDFETELDAYYRNGLGGGGLKVNPDNTIHPVNIFWDDTSRTVPV